MTNTEADYTNPETNMTGKVRNRKDGQIAVTLWDNDSGEVVSHVEIIPASRAADAHALARRWAGL